LNTAEMKRRHVLRKLSFSRHIDVNKNSLIHASFELPGKAPVISRWQSWVAKVIPVKGQLKLVHYSYEQTHM